MASPFLPASQNAAADTKTTLADASEKTQGTLDGWSEPPLPPPRPSFMDAGIERHGVVQNMAPLGALPTPKVIKLATKPEEVLFGRTANSKRSVPSAVSTPSESVMTPEPPTNPPRQRSASIKTIDEVESAPQTPQAPLSARKSASRQSVPPPQHNGQGVFQLQPSPISITNNIPRPTPPTPQPAPPVQLQGTPGPTLGADGLPLTNLDKTDRVVEEAVQEAVDLQRWPTAYALRTLYDDHRSNPRIVRLIEAVYYGRASEANYVEFKSIMRHKKREGKKDRTGEYYFNGDGSDPAPNTKEITPAPVIPAIPIEVIQPPPRPYQTPYRDMGPKSISLAGRSSSVSALPATASPKEGEENEHISKKHRSNSFQPVSTEVNGTPTANGMGTGSPARANGASNSAKSTPHKSRRARSQSTSSSLSSVDPETFEGENPMMAGADNSSRIVSLSPAANANANANVNANAHAHAHAPNLVLTRLGGHPLAGLGLSLGGAAKPHVSPYTSHNNFVAAASSAETLARNQHQPISAPVPPREKTGPKLGFFKPTPSTPASAPVTDTTTKSSALKSPTTSTSTSLANNPPASTTAAASTSTSMAPAALAASSSNSSASSFHHFPSSFKAKSLAKFKGDPYDPNDKTSRLRRRARETTNAINGDIRDSFERHQVQVASSQREQETDSEGADADSVAVPKVSKRPAKVRLLNNKTKTRESTRQRDKYDSDNLSSPTLLSFQADVAPGSLSVSRAGTPNNFGRPTRKARTGTGLRVKTSPMKKKGALPAGIPRASGERNSPTGNGASSHNQDDNDDYCSACGGNGDLVCCDGCTRSFHFKCVDPPMIQGSLPDEWFCNICQAGRPGREDPIPGTFGPLLLYLDAKNPSAFTLPKSIREYFVDVKTGADGEYEEAGTGKPKNTRGGWDEAPDYYRLKDGKGKAILCHECHGAASHPNRMIISCSFCGLNWHLDCLPNPLAKEPSQGRQWRCPAHVDDLLAQVPATLAPAHRFRRIKGASAIKPAISRGIKNNGYIEIETEPSEDEEEQGFYEQREYGHVYKLPEQGIKLDFISKVRREGGGYLPSRFATRPPKPVSRLTWNQRSVNEQQAALNLASLAARGPQDSDLSQIINTLLAEAPPAVIEMMALDQVDALSDKLPTHLIMSMKLLFDKLYEKITPLEDNHVQVSAPISARVSTRGSATPAPISALASARGSVRGSATPAPRSASIPAEVVEPEVEKIVVRDATPNTIEEPAEDAMIEDSIVEELTADAASVEAVTDQSPIETATPIEAPEVVVSPIQTQVEATLIEAAPISVVTETEHEHEKMDEDPVEYPVQTSVEKQVEPVVELRAEPEIQHEDADTEMLL